MGKIENLRPQDHRSTKGQRDQVHVWGQAGMPFNAVAARLEIDEQTCRSHYHKIWLMGKHDVIAEIGSLALNTIRDMAKTIKEADELSDIDKIGLQEKLCKSCNNFLAKRGEHSWAGERAHCTDEYYYAKEKEEEEERARERQRDHDRLYSS